MSKHKYQPALAQNVAHLIEGIVRTENKDWTFRFSRTGERAQTYHFELRLGAAEFKGDVILKISDIAHGDVFVSFWDGPDRFFDITMDSESSTHIPEAKAKRIVDATHEALVRANANEHPNLVVRQLLHHYRELHYRCWISRFVFVDDDNPQWTIHMNDKFHIEVTYDPYDKVHSIQLWTNYASIEHLYNRNHPLSWDDLTLLDRRLAGDYD